MKKVIYLYEMSGAAGFYEYTKDLAEALSKNEDYLIYFHTPNKNYKNNLENFIIINDFKKIKRYKNKLYSIIRNILVALFNVRIRNKYVKKIKPDIINANQLYPIFDQFYIAKLKESSRLVITMHDVVPPRKSRLWNLKNLKSTYEQADYLILHSKENMQLANHRFRISQDKMKKIHHGVKPIHDNISRESARKSLKITEDEFVILFFGVIRESKGLHLLIEAIINIKVKLVIAGKAIDQEYVNKCVDILSSSDINYDKHIRFIEDDEKPYFFKSADILCLPYTEFSSQSGVLMQSISYSLPVITSNVSSFETFLSEYNIGITFKNGDVDDLVGKIRYLMDNPDTLRTFTLNCNMAKQNLCWENVAKEHVMFYDSL